MPRISVLVPVYNCERYLKSALDSVLWQTFEDFDVIAVDDGSTDGSLQILERFADRDKRVRVLSRPNTGIVGALNDGLRMCQGEYIARMDGDDIAFPQRFERQVQYLDEHLECVALGTRVLLIDPEGDPIREWSVETTHASIDAAHMRGEGGAITHPSSMIRHAAIKDVGAYREQCKLAEDLDLFLRIAERGKLANLPEVLLKWRMHLASTGATKLERQRVAATLAVEEAYARRGLDCPKLDSLSNCSTLKDYEFIRIWAWWALEAGYVATARKHAWASFKRHPFDLEQLRLLVCVARGY